MNQQLSVCDTKVLYDTEFEAEISARKVEWKYGSKMHHYACYGDGTVRTPHYHIAHKHREERRGAGKNYTRCPGCYLIMRNRYDVIRKHRCPDKKPPEGGLMSDST
jgi:hypothetical protein